MTNKLSLTCISHFSHKEKIFCFTWSNEKGVVTYKLVSDDSQVPFIGAEISDEQRQELIEFLTTKEEAIESLTDNPNKGGVK